MDATSRELIMQRWNVIQHELLPELRNDVGTLTPKLEKLIHTLEWVRIEEFTDSTWCGVGRPPHERAWLANAFVAKAVAGADDHGGADRAPDDRPRPAAHLWFPPVPEAALRSHLLARFRRVCRRVPGGTGA